MDTEATTIKRTCVDALDKYVSTDWQAGTFINGAHTLETPEDAETPSASTIDLDINIGRAESNLYM